MPIVTLPDGSKKEFEKSITIDELSNSIGAGLAKATVAGKINGILVDASEKITLMSLQAGFLFIRSST